METGAAFANITEEKSDAVLKEESDVILEEDLNKTHRLFLQGLSVGEISEIRGLCVLEIIKHFEKLIGGNKIENLNRLVTNQKQNTIMDTIEKLQIEFIEKLSNSAVIEKTNSEISEEEIYLVKAMMIAEMKRRKEE